MKKSIHFFCLFTTVISFTHLNAQTYSFEIQIKNQPAKYIVLGKISGDNFSVTDTIPLNDLNNLTKRSIYKFPINSTPGMYRLILGKTTYARVMNESPQQLDFIFNNEHIILETDFKEPEDSLLVILSEENRVWFEFLQREKQFQQLLKGKETEVNFYKSDEIRNIYPDKVKQEYNTFQQQRDEFILEITGRYPELFATKLIRLYREPFLDGYLTKTERREKFQNEYFKLLDFSDESLINSSVYTDKVFYFLTSYNQPGFSKGQLENEYIKAVDIILSNTNKNPKVYEFILNYIVHGFEVLKMDNVLNYIAENYSGTTCQTDEVSTLERKLEAQKMKPGTIVPDFTLTDLEGFYVKLSDIQKEKTLILFWASWCPHCNQIIPQIKSWCDNLKENAPQIVAISLDSAKTEWQTAIKTLGIGNWINLSDLKKWDGEVTTKYNVYATPTMFLIDKNRKIITAPVTFDDLISLKVF